MAQTRCYQGNSTYSGNILVTLDGSVPPPILMLMYNIL